jgi:hypothetical protein
VQIDFSKQFSAQALEKMWEDSDMEQLDISILINNVGSA